VADVQQTDLTLLVNGQVRQRGNTADMITPVYQLIAYISRYFTLLPGDVVLTGTPAGVAALAPGDELQASLASALQCDATVVPAGR
jgi:2-keto-4-pentenoate hydratase/2-oxohepta-3-ene-1,7-dioic acid hydratase in catechol pathway